MSKLLIALGLIASPIFVFSQADSTLQKGHLEVIAEPGIEQLQRSYTSQNASSSSMMGYRVQIYNGRKAETLKMRSQVLSKFPGMQPYTLYDAPEYKLQVGDFRTRLEAERFLKRVIAEFGSGFVVKTEIKPPRLEYDMPEKKK